MALPSVDNSSNPTGSTVDRSGARKAHPLSLKKKVAFSAFTVVAFFGILELILAACGVDPEFYHDDPYVGFTSVAPLFVPRSGSDGQTVMVTAENKLRRFNPQRFPLPKPPGVYRIFCVGGSTTYGRPYDDRTSYCGWMRELLPVADQRRSWEVINAGGVSYASYRVAALMEELIRYKPDLFIIYSGHNEFLEHRTYETMLKTPPAIRDVGGVLSRTRVWAAIDHLQTALHSAPGRATESRELLPPEVSEILNLTQGPETYRRDDRLRARVLDHYRYNLERMIEMGRSVGAEVLLVTPASNLKDCTPFKSELRPGLSESDVDAFRELSGSGFDMEAGDRPDEMLAAVNRLLDLDDRHAHAHFRRGQLLFRLGRFQEAKSEFERARDEDVCPLRAVGKIQQIVREVADEHHVAIVDFARLVEDVAEHGIPGEEQFLDHVHPTIEMHRVLALKLIKELERQQVVQTGSTWTAESIATVTADIEGRIDRRAHGDALSKLSQVLGWAGKYDESRRLAERAAELIPEDPMVHYRLGCCAEVEEEFDDAVQHYLRAVELEPRCAEAHTRLGVLYQLQNQLEPAEYHSRTAVEQMPDNVPARVNLGIVFRKLGRYDQAREVLQEAIRISPLDPEANYHLGLVYELNGDFSSARRYYQQALRIRPGYPAPLERLAAIPD